MHQYLRKYGRIERLQKLIQAATEKWGGVDVLVNKIPAINPVYSPLLESMEMHFDIKIIKVNQKGPFELSTWYILL